MKRIALIAAAAAVVGFAGSASAQGNSEPGLDRYLNNPGFQRTSELDSPRGCDPIYSGPGAQGAYGFYGRDNPGGFPKVTGDTGREHGAAMAAVCGQDDTDPIDLLDL